jgi:glutamate synthase (NADPH/NADH) small chain
MAGAQQLARAGHEVVLFEREDRIGGLLRYGIPDFKMDKGIIDRRAGQMEAEGVEIRTGVQVGADLPASELLDAFDAVLLACGCEQPRDLPIEGRELRGVHFALDFLIQQNRRIAGDAIPADEEILATGKRVVVLGGGDTGSDCVGTSHRQDAAHVLNVELLPRPPEDRAAEPPWPWWPDRLITSHAHEEGGERRWSVLTKRFLGDEQGNVTGLEAVEVEWGEDPETGRPVMEDEVEGSRFTVECDLVLLALGYVHPVKEGLVDALEREGLHLTERGHVATGRRWETSLEKVFCAGDMTRGQSLVVNAISDGRRAARAVDEWLMGESELPEGPRRDLGDMLPVGKREAAVAGGGE